MSLVSVILPVYNGTRFLAEAIESVLEQTHHNLELIIVDDGSTDASAEIALDYMKRDPRVRLARQPNQGVSVARNLALDLAQGEWVACLDHDDVMLPNRIERQLAFAQANPEVRAFAGLSTYINATGKVIGQTVPAPIYCRADLVAWLETGQAIGFNQPCVMMHRDTVREVGGYNPEMRVAQDIDLWLRMAQAGHLVLQQSEVLTLYRMHPDSITATWAYDSSYVSEWALARAAARRREQPEPTLEEFKAAWMRRPLLVRLAERRRMLGWVAYRRAGALLANQHWFRGARDLVTAFCLRPLYVLGRLTHQLRGGP